MIRVLITLLLLPWTLSHAAVVVGYRGDAPNMLGPGRIMNSPFDINSDGTVDFVFQGHGIFSTLTSEGDNRYTGFIDATGFYSDQVVPIQAGTILGSDTSFTLGGWYRGDESGSPIGFLLGYDTSGFMQFADAYIGVEFQAEDGIHYGWIHYVGFSVAKPFSINLNGGFIDSWAWETEPGKAIIAGLIPEPSPALLAAGGVVLLFSRRKR